MAEDFAIATRAVLVGMAIALGAAFLLALAHPGRRPPASPPDSEADESAESAESAGPAA